MAVELHHFQLFLHLISQTGLQLDGQIIWKASLYITGSVLPCAVPQINRPQRLKKMGR